MGHDTRTQVKIAQCQHSLARIRRGQWRGHFNKRHPDSVEQTRDLQALLQRKVRADKLLALAQSRIENIQCSHRRTPSTSCRGRVTASVVADGRDKSVPAVFEDGRDESVPEEEASPLNTVSRMAMDWLYSASWICSSGV